MLLKISGKIFENSKVIDIKPFHNNYITYTQNNTVISKYVVLASHYPIINSPGFYFLKMYQERSYVIAVDVKENLFDGMYITNSDPIISFRTVKNNVGKLLLVGGREHKTGANDVDLYNRYNRLEEYIKTIYPSAEVKYKWATQDCISLDKVPYIGQFSNTTNNFYVATGFKKWGMTTSHVASEIIKNSILNLENPYKDTFSATRFNPAANFKEFGNMLKQTTYSLVLNKIIPPTEIYENLKPGMGGVVNYNNKKLGIYINEQGELFAVEPYCGHLGCELSWNNLEKTWDCPCHGSRFDYLGKLITEPSKQDLKQIDTN